MFQRITMAQARIRYYDGLSFIMVSSRLRPDSDAAIRVPPDCRHPFQEMIDGYRYYNCINRETGRGVAFYVET